MKTVAYIAVSLDGYIADKKGGVDWLNNLPNPDDSDFGWSEFISGIDAILMGRNTFNIVEAFDVWHYEVPVFVASKSMRVAPPGYEDRIAIIKGGISELLSQVRDAGYHNIYVDGGQIIQACLREHVLDELIITHIPILLGEGIPLFCHLDQIIDLEHKGTEIYKPGLIKSHYRIKRNER